MRVTSARAALLGTVAAAALFTTPAAAQENPATTPADRVECADAGPGRRGERPGHRRHRSAPQRAAAQRSGRGHRLFGRAARPPGRARHHRRRRHDSQREPGSVARHQLDADRLHPRRRPAGSGRRLRAGRRHLSRRRLSQPPAGRGARHLRRRAHRGAARAAGHALRPQHHRRRDQICDSANSQRRTASQRSGNVGTHRPARRDRVRINSADAGPVDRGRRGAPQQYRLRQEPDDRRAQL